MFKKPIIKTQQQISNIAEAGKWHNELLHLLMKASQPGTTLLEIEAQAQRFLDINNLTWSFKWYNWFPANCCLSVNDCVVHGIPDETVLKAWDLLKIDVWVTYNECISDAAVSIIIWGDTHNALWADLIKATKQSLDLWIKTLKPWSTFIQYWSTVQKTLKKAWFSVIKNLTGHGVGVDVHEAPSIYNWPHRSLKKMTIRPWMVIALEPITAVKSSDFIHGTTNERNVYTEYWDLWAQREYTIAITENGYEILAWLQ